MKFILIAVLLLLATPILVLCQTNQNDKTAKELMQLEREWVTATLKRDKVWLERFFADEFISTHPTSGTIKNKAREIADTIDPAQTPRIIHSRQYEGYYCRKNGDCYRSSI